jgi:hypothetical protein
MVRLSILLAQHQLSVSRGVVRGALMMMAKHSSFPFERVGGLLPITLYYVSVERPGGARCSHCPGTNLSIKAYLRAPTSGSRLVAFYIASPLDYVFATPNSAPAAIVIGGHKTTTDVEDRQHKRGSTTNNTSK